MLQQDFLVTAKNLIKHYGKGDLAVRALEIKSLEIMRGDFIAVTGPSGGGKTTLLNLIGGLDRPSGGEILFEGKRLTGQPEALLCNFRRRKIGFVFQAFNLLPGLTALKNVLVPALPAGGASRQRARELLWMVGLKGKEGRRPGMLSGGEQQRVAIARALILDPDLILADEPTGNLDSKSGEQIITLLSTLNRQGKTILVATHDRRVAEVCSKTISIVDGRIV